MSKCVNDKCNNNALNSINAVLVNVDGDFACCPKCKEEYEKQKEEFFANIGNDEWYNKWLND